jgi:H+-transporting ATPase
MQGLNTAEAHARLLKYGPNAIPEEKPRPLLILLKKFWGPVPWMLEASIVLELMIGRYTQAAILGILLIFNAVISFLQENKAQNALALLQKRLIVKVRVLRDNNWQILSSKELVPGDVVHLRAGDLIPADLILIDGYISVDQSALTGESLSAEIGPKETVYAGGIIQRGEATGEITATGINTYYGKTAELVHIAKTVSHLETMIVGIVKYLIILNSVLVAGVLIYSWINAVPFTEAIPFALMLLVASVPVALPATFTLASALGAQELANQGVLVTRLSTIEEAASMDVLCTDKTGTITQNHLVLSVILPFASNKEDEILRMAALGSDESSQDPIDLAIIKAAREGGLYEETQKLQFNPFDPSTKYTEAIVQTGQRTLRIIKGYPPNVAALVHRGSNIEEEVERLADKGYRVIAIAIGEAEHLELAGLIGLYDPPREDSKSLIRNLQELSIRVVMITGDSLATARAVAAQVGLGNSVCLSDSIRQGLNDHVFDCDVVAGVLPEDKYHLVQRFQQAGHVVGMTGDGVNDAPALKQAEVGIAMSNATDVAKFAASAVLSNPGLSDILSMIKIGRQIYQRMLTYTYNKIIKTFQIGLFLGLGLILTGVFVTTPRLVVLLLFANDFMTMSLASDQVSYSRKPERWAIKPLIIASLTMAFAWLVFSFAIFFLGRDIYQLDLAQLQTLVFAMLVFTGQANIYLIREQHGHFWKSRPGKALILSTIVDISAVILLTTQGILMAPISIDLIGILIGSVIIYTFGLDLLKLRIFS